MDKRNQNCDAILRALQFSGPMKRSLLSSTLKIRKTSVTYIVSDLIKAGFLENAYDDRAQSPVQISGRKHNALIASVTPADITFARVMLDGSVNKAFTTPLTDDLSPKAIADELASGFKTLLKQRSFARPLRIGVAFQGVVDSTTGTVIYSANMGGWDNINLQEMLEDRISSKVYIDNDVRCQAWAAAWSNRLLNDYENIFYVGILDGLASALVIHGQMIPGHKFSAGQIGHVTAGSDGRKCICGKLDCLEAYCSIPSIASDLRALFPAQKDQISTASQIAAIAEKSPQAMDVLEHAAERLAGILAGITAAVQPQMLLLGSADGRFTEIMRPMVETHLKSELIGIDARHVHIMVADPVENSVIRGCAGFIFQNSFKNGVL